MTVLFPGAPVAVAAMAIAMETAMSPPDGSPAAGERRRGCDASYL
jgi:hypothetical protein